MFGSVAQLCLTLQTHGLQHARPPCPSPTPGACSNSCPLSWWCYPTISPSVVPFSSCPQSFPASGAFPMSQLLTSGSQSIGVSASASVLPMNIQDWFPWRLTGLNSLYSKELSRVFSNTTVQKYPFFSTQLSLWSNSYTPRVQFKSSVMSNSQQPHGLQHARLPCPSPTPWTCSKSCPSNRWCLPTISASVIT